ncbi:MAG TPA: hypothetical protein VFJ51_09055, partial [Nitrososphaeraceae archaeon]|nr:hypothetical protein [Nitrososphaeraceae archaeon]
MHIENIQPDKLIATNAIMLLTVILFIQILTIIWITVPSQLISAASAVVNAGNITTVDIKAGSGLSGTAMPLHPSILYLHKGDTVRWVNNDNVNHSITSLLFNSGILLPKASGHGPSTFSYTFNQDGTVVYVDSLHPFLGGVIYVDVPTTQRELISTTMSFVNVKVEMPQNAAYKNNYGAFFVPASIQVPIGTKVTWSN